MTRALALQAGLGVALAAGGVAMLSRRGVIRAASEDARSYALRIIGMMCFAAGLMMAGFAIMLGGGARP